MGSTDALDSLHRQRLTGTGLHGDAADPGGSMRMARKENVITMIDWLVSCKMRWGALGMRGCFGRAAHGMVHVLAPTARSSYTRPMASGRQRLLHAPCGLQRRHAGARRQVRISISKDPCRPCILRVSVSAMRAKKTALIGFSNEAIGHRPSAPRPTEVGHQAGPHRSAPGDSKAHGSMTARPHGVIRTRSRPQKVSQSSSLWLALRGGAGGCGAAACEAEAAGARRLGSAGALPAAALTFTPAVA